MWKFVLVLFTCSFAAGAGQQNATVSTTSDLPSQTGVAQNLPNNSIIPSDVGGGSSPVTQATSAAAPVPIISNLATPVESQPTNSQAPSPAGPVPTPADLTTLQTVQNPPSVPQPLQPQNNLLSAPQPLQPQNNLPSVPQALQVPQQNLTSTQQQPHQQDLPPVQSQPLQPQQQDLPPVQSQPLQPQQQDLPTAALQQTFQPQPGTDDLVKQVPDAVSTAGYQNSGPLESTQSYQDPRISTTEKPTAAALPSSFSDNNEAPPPSTPDFTEDYTLPIETSSVSPNLITEPEPKSISSDPALQHPQNLTHAVPSSVHAHHVRVLAKDHKHDAAAGDSTPEAPFPDLTTEQDQQQMEQAVQQDAVDLGEQSPGAKTDQDSAADQLLKEELEDIDYTLNNMESAANDLDLPTDVIDAELAASNVQEAKAGKLSSQDSDADIQGTTESLLDSGSEEEPKRPSKRRPSTFDSSRHQPSKYQTTPVPEVTTLAMMPVLVERTAAKRPDCFYPGTGWCNNKRHDHGTSRHPQQFHWRHFGRENYPPQQTSDFRAGEINAQWDRGVGNAPYGRVGFR